MATQSLYRIFSEAGLPPAVSAELDLLITGKSAGRPWNPRQVVEALLVWRGRAARRSAVEAREQVYADLPRIRRPLTPHLFSASFRRPHGDGAERSGSAPL